LYSADFESTGKRANYSLKLETKIINADKDFLDGGDQPMSARSIIFHVCISS